MNTMKRAAQLLSAIIFLVGSTVPAGASWPEERPAEYGYSCQEIKVPMRDGAELAADLYMPEAEGPFPVVIERTPYNKNNCDWRGGHAAYLAERGYTVLIQDVRGRFRSPGILRHYVDEGWYALQDGYDTIEWAALQPWATGKVGTMGGSYSCFNQNMTAPSQPPHLTAMFCANAVVGIDLDYEVVGQSGSMLMVSISGTAVVVT